MEIELRVGKVSTKERIDVQLFPTLHLRIWRMKIDEKHFATMEIVWLVFGIGLKIEWPNKKYDPAKIEGLVF